MSPLFVHPFDIGKPPAEALPGALADRQSAVGDHDAGEPVRILGGYPQAYKAAPNPGRPG